MDAALAYYDALGETDTLVFVASAVCTGACRVACRVGRGTSLTMLTTLYDWRRRYHDDGTILRTQQVKDTQHTGYGLPRRPQPELDCIWVLFGLVLARKRTQQLHESVDYTRRGEQLLYKGRGDSCCDRGCRHEVFCVADHEEADWERKFSILREEYGWTTHR